MKEVCKFCGCEQLAVCEDYDEGVNAYFWFLLCLDCSEITRNLTEKEYKTYNKNLGERID